MSAGDISNSRCRERLPEWLKRPSSGTAETVAMKKLLRVLSLNTVCEEARCPNIVECFCSGTATFMILGDVCTRSCRYCSVKTGRPNFSDEDLEREVDSIARAVERLQLKHVVITSVTRDDLPDGGAREFSLVIQRLKREFPSIKVEVLIPDFRGDKAALEIVIQAGPDVLNHNLETVPRLFKQLRPGGKYRRSIELLALAKDINSKQITKTGLMLGLGEDQKEVEEVMSDASNSKVDIFTAGQYIQPSKEHIAVARYLERGEFDVYRELAERFGFRRTFIGPLVRSSYHAGESFL